WRPLQLRLRSRRRGRRGRPRRVHLAGPLLVDASVGGQAFASGCVIGREGGRRAEDERCTHNPRETIPAHSVFAYHFAEQLTEEPRNSDQTQSTNQLGRRLTAGHQTLDLIIKVRILAPQPDSAERNGS